jgi:isoquinoline 1-oxidoreductase beta subunit
MKVDRRRFLQLGAAAGVWAIGLPRDASAAAAAAGPIRSEPWCVYVAIHADNGIHMHSPVMEMGQFMRTTAPMVIADEMDLPWSAIRFSTDAPLHLKRDEKGALAYAHAQMDTGGSHAVVRNWDYLRRSGATARQMLLEEAAERWGVPVSELTSRAAVVTHAASGRQFTYGELAEAAALRTVDPAGVRLKTREQYGIIGQPTSNIDGLHIVTGQAQFGMDSEYEGALQALIARAPTFRAQIKSYDREAALAVPGVRQIIEVPRIIGPHWLSGEAQLIAAGVAVLADSLWAAMRGRAALGVEWHDDALGIRQNSSAQQQAFRDLVAADMPGERPQDFGDVEAALGSADELLDATYEQPLFAHACMEPFNCIADVRADSADVVVGNQFPRGVARTVEEMTGLDGLRVRVHSRRMGGGFGRRAEMDFVHEAVFLSQKAKAPVKVTWTREDEMEHDFFAPAGAVRIRAGLRRGKLTAWWQRHAQTRGTGPVGCFPANLVPDYRVEFCASDSAIPCGAWRPPCHLPWSFAVESMLDELAYAADEDPLAFRLKLLEPHREFDFPSWGATKIDSGRMSRCYAEAARLAQWDRKRARGTGLGIAGHFTHGTYVAFVVEVSVDAENRLRIHRAWGAIDCGLAINPNHIRNQMQGGFVDGLNAALFNAANVEGGRVTTNNFASLRWIRMAEAPRDIEISIIESGRSPTGVGEPPVPPVPAALANAIFAASGKRVRRLPISAEFSI